MTRGVVAALWKPSRDAWRRRGLIEANLLQTVTRGVVVALWKPSRDAWRRRGLLEANLIDLIDVSESSHNAPAKHIMTSIRTVDGRGSALPAPDEPEIRAYFTGVGLFS